MPDIFGREPEDYAVVRGYQEAGLWEQRQQALATRLPHAHPTHNFRAMGQLPEFYARAEPNAQVIGYIINSLQAVQTAVDEVLYLKYRLPDYMPMNLDMPEGADSYLVRILDRTGRGQFITNPGTDAPVAGVSQRTENQRLFYAGIDALWTIEDARRSLLSGVALDIRTIEAAVEGAMDHMEAVGLLGTDEVDGAPKGLVNFGTGAGKVNLATQEGSSTFDDLTGQQIYELIVDDISWVIETSRETFSTNITTGMTVYLPTGQYNRMSSRFIGDNQERSIMRAIKEDNPWTQRTGNPVEFRSVPELQKAGASSADRMIVACRDDRVFEMGVSIMPRVIEVMSKGRYVCAPVEYKFSPVFMKRPTVMRYRDKI